jgi:hypothetical protein
MGKLYGKAMRQPCAPALGFLFQDDHQIFQLKASKSSGYPVGPTAGRTLRLNACRHKQTPA